MRPEAPAIIEAGSEFRMEVHPVAGGAELLTVFSRLPDDQASPEPVSVAGEATQIDTGISHDEIPLLSLLRDTLDDDDPRNDRLRYLWVLTSAQPSLLQRAAASVPFFYYRPDLGGNPNKRPAALLDLADTERGVWGALAQSLTQVLAIDSNGTWIRASTRRYRANLADRRQVHLIEGLAVLSQLEDIPEIRTILSEPELLELQARLTLAGQTLGGLVTAEKLPEAYFKQRATAAETREQNWELLRQRAEANGLVFEPLGLGRSATHALLWIARKDVGSPVQFDGRFLHIANPYGDKRLTRWDDLTVTRYYDAEGRQVEPGTTGAEVRELIPLALYSLDYPKVPLLVVDFRDTRTPKRKEMILRATGDTLSGVIGVSRWGNWPYMTGSWAWNFVRSRQGEPTDRTARLRAYSTVRRWLALDRSLAPELRVELQERLEILGINPLEQSVFDEAEIARKQWAALLRYADDPEGLPRQLQSDRNAEMTRYTHGGWARAGLTAARVATLGIYRHQEPLEQQELAVALDRQRRAERQVRFLETVARSNAQPEAVWDMDRVHEALTAVDELAAAGFPQRSAKVVEQILAHTNDAATRALCEQALESLRAAAE